MRCLGLDLGSSSIKGAVLDLDSKTVSHVQAEPFPAPVEGLPPGWFEIDPQFVVDRAQSVISRLFQQAPDSRGLFLCSQMGGLILADEKGQAITRYLSWRDQRSLVPGPDGITPFEAFQKRLGTAYLEQLGGECKPGSATVLLSCLEKVPKGAVPLSLGDYVLSALCQSPGQVHPTAAIGLLELSHQDWHHEAFAHMGWSHLNWAPLAKTREAVGTIAVGASRLPAYPSFGDQQCALYGAGLQPGELSVNASTGAQVSRLVKGLTPGNYQTRAYFDDWNLDTITHIPAGRALNALVDLLCECSRGAGQPEFDPWAYIRTTQEESFPLVGSSPKINLSFFPGPLGETGSIRDLTLENLTVGHLFHAALESMAKGFETCSLRLDSGKSWPSVVISGGLSHAFPKLKKMLQKAFPKAHLRENPPTEETLCGLMRIASSVLKA